MELLLKKQSKQKKRGCQTPIYISFFLTLFYLTSAHSAEQFALLSADSPNPPLVDPFDARQNNPEPKTTRFDEDCLTIYKTGCILLKAPEYTEKKPEELSTEPRTHATIKTETNTSLKTPTSAEEVPIRMVRTSQDVMPMLVKNAVIPPGKKKTPVFHLIMLAMAIASFILTNRFLCAKTVKPGRLPSNPLIAGFLKTKLMKTGDAA